MQPEWGDCAGFLRGDYIEFNRALWNARTLAHVDSAFYDNAAFLAGKSSLKEIELALLGDLKGKRVLHLQCHFGQDSISMAKMGAQVVGVDLSDLAIDKARELAATLNADAQFVCCDLYDLPQHLDGQFDLVFSSYGTIGWLPDLDAWAKIVARYLKPGGKFVFVEFHPVLWMFDDDFQKIEYGYAKSEAIVIENERSYTDLGEHLELPSVSWNHSLSSVIQNLLHQGLHLDHFEEFDFSPYACFAHSEEVGPSRFRIKHLGAKIPMVYALVMHKWA
jgi:SAM-dependent methyltransferase